VAKQTKNNVKTFIASMTESVQLLSDCVVAENAMSAERTVSRYSQTQFQTAGMEGVAARG